MVRGELSNRPAGICAVDFRVLLTMKHSYVWFMRYVPELLLHKSFESKMKSALKFKLGARSWLENNWERRIVVFSVGMPVIGRAIDMIVGDYIAETYHFDDFNEMREWLRLSPQVYKVLTTDTNLLHLDSDLIRLFSTWQEKA